MRFLHTADWHLGRAFHGVHLTEDQAHVLAQLVAAVRDTRPDALVIAGDLYDRHIPPAEAVRLFDEVLCEITALGVPVLAIAGNHDSPERVGFVSRLLEKAGVHVAGPVTGRRVVTLHDAHGPVRFHLLPYAEPALVRQALGQPELAGHDGAMAALLACEVLRPLPGSRAVLVAHAFVTGGEAAESERPLAIGGADQVAAAHFAAFQYVALGHLHRPQDVGRPEVRYPGSLLKYSFSEIGDAKGVDLVEIDATGAVRSERIPLAARRDVRRIEGRLADLLATPDAFGPRDDYLHVRLLDDGPVLEAMPRLREVFPNALELGRAYLEVREGPVRTLAGDHRTMGDEALFAAFFRDMQDRALDDAERAALAAAIAEADAVSSAPVVRATAAPRPAVAAAVETAEVVA